MKQKRNRKDLATKIDSWLMRQTEPQTWKQVYDGVGIELEEPYKEIYMVMKVLVKLNRARIITPPYNNEIHYQHIVDDKSYEWPERESNSKEEQEDSCPGIYPCPFMSGRYCNECPVNTGEVDVWYKMPCPECGTDLKKLGTTKIHYCPNCGFDNRAAFETEE